MNMKDLCGDIRKREIWLYGNQKQIHAVLHKYSEVLNIKGVVTEYRDEVKLQPYAKWDIQTEMMESATITADQLIVVCDRGNFHTLRLRLLYLGKQEYRDFISSSLVDCLLYGKQLVVCMGTHLISQVCTLLESNKMFSEKYCVVYYDESNLMEPYANHLPECKHLAKCCDLYIRSECEKERYPIKVLGADTLAETCRVITVADYGFAGYFPQIEKNRDRISDYLLRAYIRLNMSYETVACAREDKELLKLCKEGKAEEDIVQTVGDLAFYSQESICAFFDNEVKRFKKLEKKADIKLGEFIEAHRGKLLCRNLNEWYEPVVSYVADEILKCLGLPALDMGIQDRERLLEDACGSDILVYPCVRMALGLIEDTEEKKYRVVTYRSVKYMTWDEYVRYTVQHLYRAIDIMEFTGMDKTLESVD